MEISTLTIEATRSAVATGKITATVLVESFYDKIQNEDSQIGAFLTLSKERAIDAASRIDKLAADGHLRPRLALWTDRIRFIARSHRAADANCQGCGDRSNRHSRP